MNLHEYRFTPIPQWMWVNVRGGNGRTMGVHLWLLEEGEPAPFTQPDHIPYHGWEPARFSWTPFRSALDVLFQLPNGRSHWIVPLCGKTSRSQWPYASPTTWGLRGGGCPDCHRVAEERGIIGLTFQDLTTTNATYQNLMAERTAWIESDRLRNQQ